MISKNDKFWFGIMSIVLPLILFTACGELEARLELEDHYDGAKTASRPFMS